MENRPIGKGIDNPLVSIITPSFNRADVIQETAESIFRQTYTSWQWVITDDGSTDESMTILSGFAAKDERIKLIKRNRLPKGACTCRNIAVENSDGEYIMFLDSDDLISGFCLEQRVKAFKGSPDNDFIIFPMLMFKKKPNDLGILWNIDKEENDLIRILRNDPICQGTGTLWKKSSFQKIGMWIEDLAVWQDIELHIRSFLWPLAYEKRMELRPDSFIRISEISLSRTGFDSKEKFNSRKDVFKYAVQKIHEKEIAKTNIAALQVMGWDLIVGSINSNHFGITTELLSICKTYNIFSRKDLTLFKNYLKMRKFKGYRFPVVNNFFYNRLQQIRPAVQSTVAQIPYSGEVIF